MVKLGTLLTVFTFIFTIMERAVQGRPLEVLRMQIIFILH